MFQKTTWLAEPSPDKQRELLLLSVQEVIKELERVELLECARLLESKLQARRLLELLAKHCRADDVWLSDVDLVRTAHARFFKEHGVEPGDPSR